MNRTQYRTIRRMARDNGRAALRWIPACQREQAEVLFFDHFEDPLQSRVWIKQNFGADGLACEMRYAHTRNTHLAYAPSP